MSGAVLLGSQVDVLADHCRHRNAGGYCSMPYARRPVTSPHVCWLSLTSPSAHPRTPRALSAPSRSLLALANCINALGKANSGKAASYVPYRNSKLTRLLKVRAARSGAWLHGQLQQAREVRRRPIHRRP